MVGNGSASATRHAVFPPHDGLGFRGIHPIPPDAGGHAEVHVSVSISSAGFFCGAARVLTTTCPLPSGRVYFGADPSAAAGASFSMPGAAHGTGGVTVNVTPHFFKWTSISWVIRGRCFGKEASIFKKTISFNGAKRIAGGGTGVQKCQCRSVLFVADPRHLLYLMEVSKIHPR